MPRSFLAFRALPPAALALFAVVSATPPRPAGAQTAASAAAPPAAPSPSAADRARALRALRAAPLVDGHNDLPWAIREHTPGSNATEAAMAAEGARGALADSLPVVPDVAAYDLRARAPGATDLARLKAGAVGGQFWSVYIPGEPSDGAYARRGRVASAPGYARVQLEQIDAARRVIARYPDALTLATRAADVAPAARAGKVAGLLGMEGGHAIENSLGLLRTYHDLGVRYMTLTHNVTLDWADAALDTARHGGLTPFGERVVGEMNRLGMLVDLSHTSDGTMSDALRAGRAPVIFSHSSARALCDHPRNVPDSILARVGANGGVVMVTFVSQFVSQPYYDYTKARGAEGARLRAANGGAGAAGGPAAAVQAGLRAWDAAHPAPRVTVAQVADHIDHVRRVAGVEHVGVGGDFDGTTELPDGLTDVSMYPALFAELARRGWSDADLRKAAGENVLRALARAERVAAEMQAADGAASRRAAVP